MLLDHGALRAEALSPEDRKAVQDFTDMTDQIADLKRQCDQLTSREVDAFVQTLQRLREKNPDGFRRVAAQVRAALD